MSKPINHKNSPYWQYDFVIKGNRFFGSTGLTGKRDAQAYIDNLRHDLLAPQRARPPITLDEACGLYEDHASGLPSWHTGGEYLIAALVAGMPKHKLLSEITQRDLMAYIARRRGERKNATINREINVIRAVWNRADKARYDVGEMPDWGALFFKVNRRAHRILGFDEQDGLIEAMRDDVADAVRFLLMSGWRRAEMIGLRWSDLDLPNRSAKTFIKGGDEVTRPLTQDMLVLIANQTKVGPFVFTYLCRLTRGKRREGERYPLSPTVLRKAWEAAQDIAGLANPIRIHDLRHTRATRIVQATGSLAAAKAALQHRDFKTTLQYAHVMDEDVRNALDASESRTIPVNTETKRKKA